MVELQAEQLRTYLTKESLDLQWENSDLSAFSSYPACGKIQGWFQ